MNKSVKVVLLSLLLYPGIGHFYLKKKLSGTLFVILFSAPLFLLFKEIIDKTNQVLAQIETGAIPFDIEAITTALTEVTSLSGSIKTYLMLTVWIISALDAYRLAKR